MGKKLLKLQELKNDATLGIIFIITGNVNP